MERDQNFQSKLFWKRRAKRKALMEGDREVRYGHSVTLKGQDQSKLMTF